MDLAMENLNGALDIRITGRMTHADHKLFRDILARVNESNPTKVIFDLDKVDFIDSSALGMLLIVRDATAQQHCGIALRGASGQVENLVKIAKLHKYFEII